MLALPLGRASGDGDLPVADGEGGGEPKRESLSASSLLSSDSRSGSPGCMVSQSEDWDGVSGVEGSESEMYAPDWMLFCAMAKPVFEKEERRLEEN